MLAAAPWACSSEPDAAADAGPSDARSPEQRAAEISDLTPNAANGKIVYETHCIDCHGADGESGSVGKRIVGEALTKRDEAILQVVQGGNGMPSFAHLTDQEIVDVIRHAAVL